MPDFEPLLDEIEISKIFGRAVPTLQKDRLKGLGPPFVKIGRLVRYRPSAVRVGGSDAAVNLRSRRCLVPERERVTRDPDTQYPAAGNSRASGIVTQRP
jgi:hypothetical protein